MRYNGYIYRWFPTGYGFCQSTGYNTENDGKFDIFIHSSNVDDDNPILDVGDKISFEIIHSHKGLQALNVKRITDET